MLPTTPLFFVSALLGLARALPVQELDRRICGTVILPSTLIQLKANQPDTSFPNTAKTDGSVLIYQDVNGATGK